MDEDKDDGAKIYNYTIKRLNSNPNLFVKKAIISKKVIFKKLPLVVNIQETAKSAMKVLKLFMFYTHTLIHRIIWLTVDKRVLHTLYC